MSTNAIKIVERSNLRIRIPVEQNQETPIQSALKSIFEFYGVSVAASFDTTKEEFTFYICAPKESVQPIAEDVKNKAIQILGLRKDQVKISSDKSCYLPELSSDEKTKIKNFRKNILSQVDKKVIDRAIQIVSEQTSLKASRIKRILERRFYHRTALRVLEALATEITNLLDLAIGREPESV